MQEFAASALARIPNRSHGPSLRRHARKCAALVAFAACGLAAPAAGDDDLDALFARDALIVVASAHACYRFEIYLAVDDPQRRRGLMFVRKLPDMTGMLFVYAQDDYLSMWMKNTYIPLDMVFARADGSVSTVVRNTEPLSLRSVGSTEPVRFVLELNAGTAERLNIDEGSRLLTSHLQTDDE